MSLSSYVPSNRKNDPPILLNLLALEVGSVAHGLIYADLREGKERQAYLAEARLGLSDLVTVCRQLAEAEGWDWGVLVFDGEERFKERMNDARKMASKKS